MSRSIGKSPKTRIQREKAEAILSAALDVFATQGFRGATIDEIAARAGLSKPNLLYYFDTKESIHAVLMERLLETWLEPLRGLDPDGDPVAELLDYVTRKLEMARDYPRESRLFANEVLQGAPHLMAYLEGPLKELVDAEAAIIRGWVESGRIAPVDPYHLIFSIWATTQHYADFDVQVVAVLGEARAARRFEDAGRHLEAMFRALLEPRRGVPLARD